MPRFTQKRDEAIRQERIRYERTREQCGSEIASVSFWLRFLRVRQPTTATEVHRSRAGRTPVDADRSGRFRWCRRVVVGDIWAVGDSSGWGPVIRRWNGTVWGVAAPANPRGNDHPGTDRFYDVTATLTGQAWAVGSYSDRNTPGPATLGRGVGRHVMDSCTDHGPLRQQPARRLGHVIG